MNKSNPLDGAYWSPVGHMKRVLYISAGQDVGGQGYRLKRALDKYGAAYGYEMRSMHFNDTYIQYPYDLLFDYKLAAKLYAEADIVQHCGGLYFYDLLDEGRAKPTVLHSHGCRLRDNAEWVIAEGASANATMIVSTIDLLQDAPSASWIPQCVDDAFLAQHRQPRADGRIRIAHAPTVRGVKGTDHILTALVALSVRYDIEVDLIEGASWAECLRRKGQCDIVVDQTTLGYGINGIEAMAMGIPVVSGFDDPADRARFAAQAVGSDRMPFHDTTGRDVESCIEEMICNPALRSEYVRRGYAFVHQYHTEQAVMKRLASIYDNVPRSTGEVELGEDLHNQLLSQMHTVRRAGFRVEVFA